MKHAAIKEKPARRAAKNERIIAVKESGKVAQIGAALLVVNTKTNDVENVGSAVRKIKTKKKTLKLAAVVSKSETSAAKIAPVSIDNKIENKKIAASVSVEKTVTKKCKPVPVKAATTPKTEKKKAETSVSAQTDKLNKEAAVSVQKIELQIKKPAAIAMVINVPAEIQKIKSAVNVGRINAALKAIEAAQANAADSEKKDKKDKRKLTKLAQKSEIAEANAETPVARKKVKPRVAERIGAAVFRGRKTRYDFQVYPLDFAFENVPAIYVISKRKTDHKKRAHHSLVCIGQTDSILSELQKHTQSKCVKKHEANVISILPEKSEKKRLKIEEDLKAAHQIVCNIE